MIRWATAQPLDSRLERLLEEACWVRVDWHERHTNDLLVFQPLAMLLRTGRLPLEGIHASYRMVVEATDSNGFTLLHGGQLLGCQAKELRNWSPGMPLPKHRDHSNSYKIEEGLALALVQASPELANHLHLLNQRALGGNSGAGNEGAAWRERLSAIELVDEWNLHLRQSRECNDAGLLRLQMHELEEECERQYMVGRDLSKRLSLCRRFNRQALQDMEKLIKANLLLAHEIAGLNR
jgi:hypothetical protein